MNLLTKFNLVLIVVFGGCGIYFYLQNANAEHEAGARTAFRSGSMS